MNDPNTTHIRDSCVEDQVDHDNPGATTASYGVNLVPEKVGLIREIQRRYKKSSFSGRVIPVY